MNTHFIVVYPCEYCQWLYTTYQGGIPGDKLTIALEPEAASLFCRYLPVEKFVGKEKMSISNFKTGTKYIVLDAGGNIKYCLRYMWMILFLLSEKT